jgi:hypothetical protein
MSLSDLSVCWLPVTPAACATSSSRRALVYVVRRDGVCAGRYQFSPVDPAMGDCAFGARAQAA